MLKTINITPALLAQIDRVRRAQDLYPNEDDGTAPLECEELALARLVVDAYDAQECHQGDRLARLPKRTEKRAAALVIAAQAKRRARGA